MIETFTRILFYIAWPWDGNFFVLHCIDAKLKEQFFNGANHSCFEIVRNLQVRDLTEFEACLRNKLLENRTEIQRGYE